MPIFITHYMAVGIMLVQFPAQSGEGYIGHVVEKISAQDVREYAWGKINEDNGDKWHVTVEVIS